MRYQCCDSIRPSRDVPASCHILPREGDAKSTAAERTRCHAFPHFNPSLQPQLVDIGYPKGVFRGLSAHAGGSASCDSATTLFKTSQRAPLFYRELQKHPSSRSIAFQPYPALTSTLSSPPILRYHSPMLSLLLTPGTPFLLCPICSHMCFCRWELFCYCQVWFIITILQMKKLRYRKVE